eukprot:TRINITY_DN7468_c0_g1_i2.p2 TRINITY_DN7468_c0_g1~~TRINITY_DN7468_c0_g1_i2.p2  ORF type:complete len:120 (-),score=30.53 TRINITY_DN7468_c0_g1_i2:66-425(-)
MASRNHVLPVGWDWDACLKVASGLLKYAFEKSDAQEKYGGENVFAVIMGGRSLRYTAEHVLGSGAQGEQSDTVQNLIEKIDNNQHKMWNMPKLFKDVGGLAVWKGLLQRLRKFKFPKSA